MRIREMISNLRSFDCYTNSPCQYQWKCIEKSKEKTETDVRIKRLWCQVFNCLSFETLDWRTKLLSAKLLFLVLPLPESEAHGLQTFLVFSQHLMWFIMPVNS